MKELSIEEKAKSFKEALSRAKGFYKRFPEYKEILEKIFPELAESEDEKWIPKEIAKYLKEKGGFRSCWIAWLERQGEQKSIDKVEPKFNKGDILYEQKTMSILLVYERNGSWLMTFCDYWMLKEKFHVVLPYEGYGFVREMSLVPATKEQRDLLFQKMHEAGYEWDAEKKELKKIEQNPVIGMKTPEESLGIDSDTYNKIVDECIYDEQKSDWSEEDSKNMKECVIAVSMSEGHTREEKEQLEDWLKYHFSQKQCNYNPYKEVVESIAKMCKNYDNMDVGSLQDFYDNVKVKCKDAKEYDSLFPQSTWKPSEEMLEALYRVIPENVMEKSEDEMLLDKLYQGLKYGRVLSEK